jgi:predicted phosphodiesterase
MSWRQNRHGGNAMKSGYTLSEELLVPDSYLNKTNMEESKRDVAREYAEKFIQLGLKYNRGYSKRSIAQNLFEERPDMFSSVEDARYSVRAILSAAGGRQARSDAEISRRFTMIEDGAIELPNNQPFEIPDQYKKALCLADLHSRFCDKKALEIAVKYGIKAKCDCVIINGDFMDFYQHSRFDKNANIIQYFDTENDWGISVLSMLQSAFGKVFLKKGNHCIRREQRIQKLALQMPELMDMQSFAECLFFDGSTVEIIEDYRVVKFGKLNIIHGHEYQGGGGIHVAYNRMTKSMDNVLSAHSHVAQSDLRKTIDGSVIVSVTLGCLCDLHPRYNPMNSWTQGFAVVERLVDGNFMIDNRVIINGVAYPR